MFRGKTVVWILAVTAMAAAGLISQALSQDTGQQPRARRGQMSPEEMRQRMEQFRQQQAQQMKEALGATDEEWKALQPKVEKVQTLARQVRPGGMGMTGRAGGGRGARGGAQPAEGTAAAPQSDLDKKFSDLQKVAQNKEAKPEDIKTALAAYREARAKAREELEKAQKELREILSVRQEAQLVTMGILE